MLTSTLTYHQQLTPLYGLAKSTTGFKIIKIDQKIQKDYFGLVEICNKNTKIVVEISKTFFKVFKL